MLPHTVYYFISTLEIKNKSGMTPLHIASSNGYSDIVKYLIKSGANLEEETSGKATPLLCASYYGHIEIVNFLIQNGADSSCHDQIITL